MAPTLGRQRRRRPTVETRAAALDAAEACFSRYGIAQTTIDDIVREAGIPRATLYRHAGNRDELLVAVTAREIERTFAKLTKFITGLEDFADVIVDGTIYTIKLIRQTPLLSALLAGAPGVIDGSISDQTLTELLDRLHAWVEPLLEPAQAAGIVRPGVTVPDAVELLLRTIQSQVAFEIPGRRTPAQQREYFRLTLLPVFLPDT